MDPADLRESEKLLCNAFAHGDLVDLGGGNPVADEARSAHWAAGRQVRGEIIGLLLRGSEPPRPGYTPKVQLAGARIVGKIDLNGARVEAELLLDRCWVDDDIDLTDARMRAVVFDSCRLATIMAARLTTAGPFFLNKCLAKALVLAGAKIEGVLALDGTCLVNVEDVALLADNVTVEQNMSCHGFTGVGAVRLAGADIGGQLVLDGASLSNPGGDALFANSLTVAQDMSCRAGFTAVGALRLAGADIAGQLAFDGASLTNPGGDALFAENLNVGLDMFCHDGFTAAGLISLAGANVEGQLVFSGASLINPGGEALLANGLTVGQDMLCYDGFSATGETRLLGAHVGGHLSLSGASLSNPGGDALRANSLTVDRDLLCHDGFTVDGAVSLQDARIEGRLDLRGDGLAKAQFDGLHYGGILPPSAAGRLADWISADTHGFHAQPYEYLASYLRGLGQDALARKVMLRKQRAHRRALARWRRLPGWLLDGLSGYGYAAGRSFALLLAAVAAGWLYFHLAGPPQPAGPASPAFTGWYSLLYVIDVVIPTSPFGQESQFAPVGTDLYVVVALQAFGWLLSIALLPAVTRALSRI